MRNAITRHFKRNITDILICVTLACVFVLLSSGTVFGQGNVGINNATPHAKSLLDLTSQDKGLLVPRMTAAERTAMFPVADATARGMLVYQTDGAQGFHYYDGAVWIHMDPTASAAGWELDGNAGTDPVNDFIGTTDSRPLIFRTNNVERLRIGAAGNLGIGMSPIYNLDMLQPQSVIRMNTTTNNDGSVIELRNTTAGNHMIGQINFNDAANSYGGALHYHATNGMAFYSGSQNRMRLSTAGNLGLGMAPAFTIDMLQPQSVIRMNTTTNNDGSVIELRNTTAGDHINGMINFNDATNSYGGSLWYHQTGGMIFRSGSQERMRLSTAGNLGLGMTPVYNLDMHAPNQAVARLNSGNAVNGTVIELKNSTAGDNNLGAINFNNAANSYAGQLSYHTVNGMTLRSGGAERMRIVPAGNVGIGTTVVSPNHRLNVEGNSNWPPLHVRTTSATGFSGAHFANDLNTALAHIGVGNSAAGSLANLGYAGTATNHAFVLTTNDVERMRIAANGNVGIGMAPFYNLDLHADNQAVARFNSGNAVNGTVIELKNSTAGDNNLGAINFNNAANNYAGQLAYHVSHGMTFRSGGAERMRIAPGGNVGVGVAAPLAKFHVEGAYAGWGVGLVRNTDPAGWSGIEFRNHLSDAASFIGFNNGAGHGYAGTPSDHPFRIFTNGLSRLTVAANGDVGIGTNTPTTKLEVNGFTKLGNDAPAIKVKKLTGTTAATEGGVVDIAHGLASAKILGIQVLVQTTGGNWLGEAYTHDAEYQVHALVMAANIRILNHATNSGFILNRPVKILVTYEE
ncbi:MAG: hypothetical protein KIT10_11580 [Flavobacteriales bacterium]|nr:hypothetical protein [Flavobacteriales bacterium]